MRLESNNRSEDLLKLGPPPQNPSPDAKVGKLAAPQLAAVAKALGNQPKDLGGRRIAPLKGLSPRPPVRSYAPEDSTLTAPPSPREQTPAKVGDLVAYDSYGETEYGRLTEIHEDGTCTIESPGFKEEGYPLDQTTLMKNEEGTYQTFQPGDYIEGNATYSGQNAFGVFVENQEITISGEIVRLPTEEDSSFGVYSEGAVIDIPTENVRHAEKPTVKEIAETPEPPSQTKTAKKLMRLSGGIKQLFTNAKARLQKKKGEPSTSMKLLEGLSSDNKAKRNKAVKTLAREFEKANFAIFSNVEEEEFNARKFDSTKQEDFAEFPHLRQLAEQQEAIQSVVKHHVMTGSIPTDEGNPRVLSDSERKNIVESYINLADRAHKKGDYVTASAITLALSTELTPLVRNAGMSDKSKAKLTSLEGLQYQKTYLADIAKRRKAGKSFIPAPGATFVSITQAGSGTVGRTQLADQESDTSKLLASFEGGSKIRDELEKSGEEVPFDTLVRALHKHDLKANKSASHKPATSDLAGQLDVMRAVGGAANTPLENLRALYSQMFKGKASLSEVTAAIKEAVPTSRSSIQSAPTRIQKGDDDMEIIEKQRRTQSSEFGKRV